MSSSVSVVILFYRFMCISVQVISYQVDTARGYLSTLLLIRRQAFSYVLSLVCYVPSHLPVVQASTVNLSDRGKRLMSGARFSMIC